MNLTRPSEVRQLARGLGLRPRKTLGQNFLIDRNILEIILDGADLQPGEGIIEIGPGLGVLTEGLLERGCRVLAVEKDSLLFAHLSDCFAGDRRFELRQGDFLDFDAAALVGSGYSKVVSNLPYASGTRMLVELVLARPAPGLLVVTLQEEVCDRVVAQAGSSDYGMLSLWVQAAYEVEKIKRVSPSCFWPRPEVASAIVKARRRAVPLLEPAELDRFREVTQFCFRFRRKQMQTILKRRSGAPDGAGLSAAGIDPAARPEDVTLDQWCRLARLA